MKEGMKGKGRERFGYHCLVFFSAILSLLAADPSGTAAFADPAPPAVMQRQIDLDAGRKIINLSEDTPEPALDLKAYLEREDPRAAARELREMLRKGEISEASTLQSLQAAERQQVRTVEDILVFNGSILRPAPGVEAALLQTPEGADPTAPQKRMAVILQLDEELTLEDTIACLELGVRFYEQISRGAILAAVDSAALSEVAAKKSFRWAGSYRPEYKYTPETAADPRPESLVYPLGGDRPEFRGELQELGAEIKAYYDTPKCYHVHMDYSRLEDLARLWWVKGISKPPREVPEAMLPVSVNFEPNDSREFILAYQSSWTGSGVTLGVRDMPVYETHPQLSGIFHSASRLDGSDDHGTMVSGVIAGRAKTVSGPWGPTEVKGVAPQAQVLFRPINDVFAYPEDFQSFINNNVMISNHSYYLPSAPFGYDAHTTAYDAYCDNNDMIIVKSAGNQTGAKSITNPGTGKNVLAAGAVNYVTIPGETAGARAAYSSQGPTAEDGRLKPELVAPGGGNSYREGVVSTSSDAYDPSNYDNTRLDGNYQDYEWESDDYYQRYSGTSFAAPHVTGILGKLRQLFPAAHSELLKAMLINTTIVLKGNSDDPMSGYANTAYGYGLADGFSVTTYYNTEKTSLINTEGEVSEDAREDSITLNVPAGARKLVVTLAYNDQEGRDQPADALKDDLDLILVEPGIGRAFVASSYYRNVPGVTAQSPLEKMVIVNPVAGAWTAKVRFVDSPDFLTPVLAVQRYGLSADAILKTPELSAPALSQTTYNVGINQEFVLAPTITNTGGHIAAGVRAIVEGPTSFSGDVNKSRFIGTLPYQNAAVTPQLKIKAPSASGTYSLVVKADGINKEFATAAYPKQTVVTVNVTGTAGQVTRPAGGEAWNAGSSQAIAWSGFSDPYVKIELYRGAALSATVNSSAANNGATTWTIPAGQAAGTDYRIKITSTANSNLYAFSNYFTIVNTPAASLTVTYPSAAGIRAEAGTNFTVTWNSAGAVGSQVDVMLFKGSVSQGYYTVPNTGSSTWSIPLNQEPRADYRFRVIATSNPLIFDESDNPFTIYSPEPPAGTPTVRLVWPSGPGLSVAHGESRTVTWSTTGNAGNTVRLGLYKGGAIVGESTAANSGASDWTILPSYAPGSDYKFKISLVDHPDIYDWSDNDFAVSAASQGYSLSPDSGTIGTQATLTGSGYGSVKGKLALGSAKATVLAWSPTSIEFLLKKPVSAGLYSLVIQPKSPKGAPAVTLGNCFTVRGPRIDSATPSSGAPGQSVTVSGSYFGTKKGQVTLKDSAGTNHKCKVVGWSMDARTNSSQVVFLVPAKASGRLDITVTNKIGSGVLEDGFQVP
jgi:hypothetical protein